MEVNINNFNYIFEKNKITYISDISILDNIYLLNNKFNGSYKIGNKKIDNTFDNLEYIKSKIFYINKDYKKLFTSLKVEDDIRCIINNYSKEELFTLLSDFKLDNNILNKSYLELSDGELKKIIIICILLDKRKIILIDSPTFNLDYKSKETLIKKLKKYKREDKIIVINSGDTDFLIKVCDTFVVVDENKVFNDKYEFFNDSDTLNKLDLIMPELVSFKNELYKQKNIKLLSRDNINDIIKDIYRNVK